ncbi:MAG: iron-containing alcohol dehydrogenase [Sulfuricella sp.]|jgi:alcohol dehydrogenase|nr:iron-containing alcohol dehydrogenase [Sulfuricella sp.]
MFAPFSIARLPRIEFGAGSIKKLPAILDRYGKRVLLVSGGHSFLGSPHWEWLRAQGFGQDIFTVTGEPSPQLVDEAVANLRDGRFDVVLGIGGGSVLDAAKAIAGLLRPGNSVMDHLEGVGPELPYRGPATPFVAVPTTAGTGSEATRNAVLSVPGANGFKKSFRDEQLVAEYAVVDPDLLASCPPPLIAANGMDAFTQLLESFVSSKANPFTDALAWSGMEAVRDGLPAWYGNGPEAPAGREKMAYAALLSGITLAQAGLGSVHGLAAPLGAFFPIPHGVACGTLLAAATRVNIEVMTAREPANPALAKYARVGRLLHGMKHGDDIAARSALLQSLEGWTERMDMPRLGAFGASAADLPRIVANCRGSSMKTNPVALSDNDVGKILRARL